MIALDQKHDFAYRQVWGKQSAAAGNGTDFDWDKSQVGNNSIYLANDKINAMVDRTPAEQVD